MTPTGQTASPQITPSVVRTIAALVAGALVTALLRFGVKIDSTAVLAVVQPAVTAAYYFLARILEDRVNPKLGWLLGLASAPNYVDKPAPAPPSTLTTSAPVVPPINNPTSTPQVPPTTPAQ